MLTHSYSDQPLDILAHHINDILTPFDSNQEGNKTKKQPSPIYDNLLLIARNSFFNVIRQIIKVTAYQERDGLADIVLLLTGSPTSIPEVK